MPQFNPRTDTFTKSSQSNRAFSNLTGKASEDFHALGMEVDYSRGANLFLEGQHSQYVFVICSGQVKLSVTSAEGKTVIVRIAHAGDMLGLSAALNGNDHEVTAEVLENCRVKAIRVKDFVAFIRQYPEAAMETTRCILQEYQVVFNDVCRLALPSTVAGRLANLLLEWTNARTPSRMNEPNRVIVTLTHEEIAGMTGTSRESVSRTFQEFQREKMISVKGSSLTVLRPEALEQLAV